MKIITLLLTLLYLSQQILDRSYYDALCNLKSMQSCQWVRVRKIFEMHFVNYPRSTTLIETLDQGNDSRRSMWVQMMRLSIWDSFRWRQEVSLRPSWHWKNEWSYCLPAIRFQSAERSITQNQSLSLTERFLLRKIVRSASLKASSLSSLQRNWSIESLWRGHMSGVQRSRKSHQKSWTWRRLLQYVYSSVSSLPGEG